MQAACNASPMETQSDAGSGHADERPPLVHDWFTNARF